MKIIIEGVEYNEEELKESFERDREIIESFGVQLNFNDYLAMLKVLYLS